MEGEGERKCEIDIKTEVLLQHNSFKPYNNQQWNKPASQVSYSQNFSYAQDREIDQWNALVGPFAQFFFRHKRRAKYTVMGFVIVALFFS